MSYRLSKLPIEIIELITEALEPPDIYSIRLGCRELNAKTLRLFGRKCFASVRTTLARQSLKQLESISGKEHLKNHIQTLIIREDSHGCGRDNLGNGFSWPRNHSGRIIDPQPGAQILQDLLLNRLLNCRSFYIRGGGSEDIRKSDQLVPSDVVGIILNIVAEIAIAVNSLFLDFNGRAPGSSSTGSGSSVDLKRLQVSLYRQPKFRSGWVHLKELLLEQSMKPETFDWTMELISQAPNLRKLALDFHFSSPLDFGHDLSLLPIPRALQEFTLRCANLTMESLSKFLFCRRESLLALSFWLVTIEGGGEWKTVLRSLKSNLPLLESIEVMRIFDRQVNGEGRDSLIFTRLSSTLVIPGSHGQEFQVRYKVLQGERRIIGASYRGPQMEEALRLLADSAECLT